MITMTITITMKMTMMTDDDDDDDDDYYCCCDYYTDHRGESPAGYSQVSYSVCMYALYIFMYTL